MVRCGPCETRTVTCPRMYKDMFLNPNGQVVLKLSKIMAVLTTCCIWPNQCYSFWRQLYTIVLGILQHVFLGCPVGRPDSAEMTHLVGFGSILVLPQARWSISDAFEARKQVQIDRNVVWCFKRYSTSTHEISIPLAFQTIQFPGIHSADRLSECLVTFCGSFLSCLSTP